MIEGWSTKDVMALAYVVGLMGSSIKAEDVADPELFHHGMTVCMQLLQELYVEGVHDAR